MKLSPPPSPSPGLRTTEKVALLLVPLLLAALIFTLSFSDEFHLLGRGNLRLLAFTAPPAAPPPGPEFRLLMGVLTLGDRYLARHRLRMINALQPPVAAQIDVKFVLCNLSRDDEKTLVALEIMLYDDIIILNCKENMNGGKTYTFFSSLPGLFGGAANGTGRPYDFVMKTDDDTIFMLPRLVESLRIQPREDLYWGHAVPPKDGRPLFMAGMGYVLSWDLVEWIAASEAVKNHTMGPEDTVVGEWLRDGGRGKNVYSTRAPHLNFDTKPVMYDYPYPPYTFVPNTISVHRLKETDKLAETLRYFNVTAGLKPSKFYHLW